MIAERPAGAGRLALRLRPHAAAGVDAPHLRRIRTVDIARPPILGGARGMARKEGRIQRGRIAEVVVHDAEQLRRRRQAPIRKAARGHAAGPGRRVLPSRLADIDLLPHQARDPVGDRAVAIVGVARRVDRVIGVFAKDRGGIDGLAGIGKFQHARSGHAVGREAIAAVIIGRGGAGYGRQPPSHRQRLGVRVAVDAPALVIRVGAHLDAHKKLIRRRRPGERLDEMARGIRLECDRILVGDDARALHRLGRITTGAGRAHALHLRLAVNLAAKVNDRAVERGGQIRIRRARRGAADRVIVIVPRAVVVPALGIERLPRRPVGFRVTVNRITVQSPRHRLVDAEYGL